METWGVFVLGAALGGFALGACVYHYGWLSGWQDAWDDITDTEEFVTWHEHDHDHKGPH